MPNPRIDNETWDQGLATARAQNCSKSSFCHPPGDLFASLVGLKKTFINLGLDSRRGVQRNRTARLYLPDSRTARWLLGRRIPYPYHWPDWYEYEASELSESDCPSELHNIDRTRALYPRQIPQQLHKLHDCHNTWFCDFLVGRSPNWKSKPICTATVDFGSSGAVFGNVVRLTYVYKGDMWRVDGRRVELNTNEEWPNFHGIQRRTSWQRCTRNDSGSGLRFWLFFIVLIQYRAVLHTIAI